jgi:hypothetical protein
MFTVSASISARPGCESPVVQSDRQQCCGKIRNLSLKLANSAMRVGKKHPQ